MNVNLTLNNIYKSKCLKRGLEFAADNGTLFAAGTSLALSTFVRPVSIMLTPNTNKENKKFACAKSIASSAAGYLMMMGASVPISRGVKKVDSEPSKYLKPETIQNLTERGKTLLNSKGYQFAMQMFKLGAGAVAAAPKAMITCLMIPPIMKAVFNNNSGQCTDLASLSKNTKINNNKKDNNKISFTGGSKTNLFAAGMGKAVNTKLVQRIANKYKDSNFAMHTMAATDTITTLTFVQQTKNSKKIDSSRKNPLIYNALISTGLSIGGAYAVDKALDKPAEKFIKNFSEINKNSPKLNKYVEGIKIAKPTLILGGIYYSFIPLVSTFLADRVETKAD